MAESKTSKRRLSAAEKMRAALQMRTAGATFEAIARELNYANASGAYYAVETALRATLQEPADELRKVELRRLDAALQAIWPKVLSGNLGAIDRMIRLQERRSRYLGLDAPAKVNVKHIVDEVAAEFGLNEEEAKELALDVSRHLTAERQNAGER